MSGKPDYLECPHCGDVAVESATGLFAEDDADRCQTCGIPGHVSVDDYDEGPGADFYADDASHCARPDCDECAELRAEAASRKS